MSLNDRLPPEFQAAFQRYMEDLYKLVFPQTVADSGYFQDVCRRFLADLAYIHRRSMSFGFLCVDLVTLGLKKHDAIRIILSNIAMFEKGLIDFHANSEKSILSSELVGRAIAKHPAIGGEIQQIIGDNPIWKEIFQAAAKQRAREALKAEDKDFWAHLPGKTPFSAVLLRNWCVPTGIPPFCLLDDKALLDIASGHGGKIKPFAAGLSDNTLRKRLNDAGLIRAPRSLLFHLKTMGEEWLFYRKENGGYRTYKPPVRL